MNRFRILEEAVAELEAAAAWYEEQSEGLGLALVAEFRRRLGAALETPGTGSPRGVTPGGAQIRRCRLHRFKRYAIVLATIGQIPTVLAVEHSSRMPGYWRNRLK